MANHSLSAGISALLAVVLVGTGQVLKAQLAESRQGTLVAGLLGALVFLFSLTAISNQKMSVSGTAAKSGLADVVIALIIGIASAASIHRIAITICLIFSIFLLYLTNVISQQRYNVVAKPVSTGRGKK